jgi:hypothetical protein
MNPQDMKQVMEALQNAASKVELEPASGMGNLIKITTQFRDRNGSPFAFYAYTRGKRKKIFLTDAGLILGTLQKSGMGLQMGLVQSLLRTYGLMFTQEGVVIDQSDRSIEERVTALFQAWCAADGVLRTWTRQEG